MYGTWPALNTELRHDLDYFKIRLYEFRAARPCAIHIVVGWRPVKFIEAVRLITHKSICGQAFRGPKVAQSRIVFSTQVRLESPRVGCPVFVRLAKFPALAHNVYI